MEDLRNPEDAERLEAEAPDEYLRRREFLQRTALSAGLATSLAGVLSAESLVAEAATKQRRTPLPSPRNMPIDTFVVLMMENRSFDHYLGWLPNADGRQGGLSYKAFDGKTEKTHPLTPDYQGCAHPDPGHGWNSGRVQLNDGKCDGFIAKGSGNDGFAIGYYGENDLPFAPHVAKQFTTCDRYFSSIMASTYPNREYMHAGESYGKVSNDMPQTHGRPATASRPTRSSTRSRRRGSTARSSSATSRRPRSGVATGLQRSEQIATYYPRCANGSLPALSFVDPPFLSEEDGLSGDEHPHGDVRIGQAIVSDVVHAFMDSPQWERGALFITYDEWGGFFDHVRPPRVPDLRNSRKLADDYGQMGFRVPTVIVSPYAKKGHVAHDVYGHESVLKMLCYRFGLAPLNKRVRYARNIARAFDWESKPRQRPSLPDPPTVVASSCGVQELLGAKASRPKEHDFEHLLTSGYLDRLGFDYKPWEPETVFREGSKVKQAHRGTK